MELIHYQPYGCKPEVNELENCSELVAYARFNVSNASQTEASLQFLTTIFTCIIMTIGSLLFSHDTDEIIIAPVARMVTIIKQLADDPLQKP